METRQGPALDCRTGQAAAVVQVLGGSSFSCSTGSEHFLVSIVFGLCHGSLTVGS